MTTKKEINKKFYKQKGFWAAVLSGVGGVLAGNAGVVDVILQVYNYIIGG